MLHKKLILFSMVCALLFFLGCESLKAAKPIMPIKEYERLIVGRLDANYIGTVNCLAACHYHDTVKEYFDASTMGMQLSPKSGMPLVDCESCHGPGSLAVEDITPEKVAEDAKAGKQTACKYDTLIDLKNLPAPAQSLICLKCHTAGSHFNVHNWNSGSHALNDVSCFDCHNVHMGPDLTIRKEEMENLCEKCHIEVKAQFSMPSHHPIHEKKIFCNSCHDPHGSPGEKNLRKPTIKEICVQCHADKEGPYLYEHAENTEDCTTCHLPHGSANNNLLTVGMPFLCLQCHDGHRTDSASTSKPRFYTRCTDCHSQIHGTDLPSRSGTGLFTF